ncbi:hypothetical protein ACU686_44505 [Yinghuangia aomiensis]
MSLRLPATRPRGGRSHGAITDRQQEARRAVLAGPVRPRLRQGRRIFRRGRPLPPTSRRPAPCAAGPSRSPRAARLGLDMLVRLRAQPEAHRRRDGDVVITREQRWKTPGHAAKTGESVNAPVRLGARDRIR